MKNIITYYYHFAHIYLHYHRDIYTFEKDSFLYIFKKLDRPLEECKQIQHLFSVYPFNYHKIILNKDQQFITFVNQKPYVLLQIPKKDHSFSLIKNIQEMEIVPINKEFSLLKRDEWSRLWSLKVDYIEYQLKHVKEKYSLLVTGTPYFLGLAENAITYFEDTILHEKKEWQDQLVLCHLRILENMDDIQYFDPFQIVLDHKARDVAEYLKTLFFHYDYQKEDLMSFIYSFQFSKYGYRLLLARLLYPSYYFDLYENIILGIQEEDCIKDIIIRIDSYQKFLKMIYEIINQKVEIPPIDWL